MAVGKACYMQRYPIPDLKIKGEPLIALGSNWGGEGGWGGGLRVRVRVTQ